MGVRTQLDLIRTEAARSVESTSPLLGLAQRLGRADGLPNFLLATLLSMRSKTLP
jgi:hypothetical protein